MKRLKDMIVESLTNEAEEVVSAEDLNFDYEAYKKNSMGYSRSRMPQIDDEHIPYVLDHFRKHPTWKIRKMTKAAAGLKPTQNEVNLEKVRKMMSDDQVDSIKDRVYITSHDFRLADGHHSHLASLLRNSSTPLQVYQTSLPIDKLIRVLNSLKVTYKKDVTESKK